MTAAQLRLAQPGDAGPIADLHAHTLETNWDAAAIRALLDRPSGLGIVVEAGERLVGFALIQSVADEAELLSIAVSGDARKQGLGHRMIDFAVDRLRGTDVRRLFLEVAADNRPACALYAACGFTEFGRRKGYYTRPGGAACDAILLVLPIAPYPS